MANPLGIEPSGGGMSALGRMPTRCRGLRSMGSVMVLTERGTEPKDSWWLLAGSSSGSGTCNGPQGAETVC